MAPICHSFPGPLAVVVIVCEEFVSQSLARRVGFLWRATSAGVVILAEMLDLAAPPSGYVLAYAQVSRLADAGCPFYVLAVLLASNGAKMGRIHAEGYMAAVINDHTIGDWTVCQFIRQAVNSHLVARRGILPYEAIPARHAARPKPAVTGGRVDILPKAVHQGDSAAGHATEPNGLWVLDVGRLVISALPDVSVTVPDGSSHRGAF